MWLLEGKDDFFLKQKEGVMSKDEKIIKQSRALLLMLAFLLAFAPLSTLAGSGEKPTVNYVALGDSLAKGDAQYKPT